MFEQRRRAAPAETAALVASFDAVGLELDEAEVSEIATLAELGRAHTVLRVDAPAVGGDFFYTIAEVAPVWAGGGGTAHDQDAYRRALARLADPAYEPEPLFAPTKYTSSGWWMIDAIHRAAALAAVRPRSSTGLVRQHARNTGSDRVHVHRRIKRPRVGAVRHRSLSLAVPVLVPAATNGASPRSGEAVRGFATPTSRLRDLPTLATRSTRT